MRHLPKMIKIITMIGFSTLLGSMAFAETAEEKSMRLEQSGRKAATEVLRAFDHETKTVAPGCFTCAGQDAAPPNCREAYSKFYSKPTLDFRITLGYSDYGIREDANGPIKRIDAEDGPRRAALSDRLLRKCPLNGVGVCGFEADPKDIEHYIKRNVLGPDGQPHTIDLHLVSSSASMDDQANRTTLRDQQALQSQRAHDNFMVHGMHAALNLYAGHAREGGGTSYRPPPLQLNSLRVDESVFADRASEKEMLNALRGNPNPPAILGDFACRSATLFADNIRIATKDPSGKSLTAVITSDGLTNAEVAFGQLYMTLDSVLALRCKTEFVQALNSIKRIWNNHGKGAELTGLFDEPPAAPARQTPLAPEPPAPDRYRTDAPLVSEKLIHPTEQPNHVPKDPPLHAPTEAGSVN
jgi:hypothetical protein